MDQSERIKFKNVNSGIIDSHAHLLDEFFGQDKASVIERMSAVNVKQVINPGIDLKSIPELIELAEQHENIFIGLGLHPHQASEWNEETNQTIKNFISHPKVVAVGECGLDFFYDNSPREIQIFALQEQLNIARQFDKAVIIHCRDAWDELFTILQKHGSGLKGVLHCFTGTTEIVNRLQDMSAIFDYYISFSGIVTFPKATALQASAKIVSPDRLLVETDCPYLAPHPVRGERNEPAYVWYVAEKLAQLRNQSIAEIATLSSNNTRKLFGLPGS